MFLKYYCNKFLLVILCFGLNKSPLFSQKVIEVKYEPDSKGGYVFSCMNYAYCNYILDLGFTTFNNVKSDQPLPFHREVKPGFNKLFTITLIDGQAPSQFNFKSKNQKGCIRPEVNRNFIYLLPITPGSSAQVYEMSPDRLPDSPGKSVDKMLPGIISDSAFWYVLRLKMKPGDTIYAARKGRVTELQDQNGGNDAGQSSIGTQNYIEIVQADCSFARYGILKKNSALVKPGQSVNAGQPVGLVGGDPYGRGSELRFSVYYFQEENVSSTKYNTLHYIVPQIWTKNNGKGKLKHGAIYTSEFPAALLDQQIRKKSKK